MTARWVVEGVAPQRDLSITWQPISLLVKNDVTTESPYYEAAYASHRMLRVMEAVRATSGDHDAFRWYWECATRIHHDRDLEFDLGDALEQLGLDHKLAAAGDDESIDIELRRRMDAGLALVGEDVGTPIIAFTDAGGVQHGIFGPVMSRVPRGHEALRVWDAMEAFTIMDGFWELKRTRTQDPDFGERPDRPSDTVSSSRY